MDIEFTSDVEYIRNKLKSDEICSNKEKAHVCGVCFWQNVTMLPKHAVKYKCNRCLTDTKNIKKELLQMKNESLKYNPDCSKYCVWWDWFDVIRQNIAKGNNCKIIYTKEDKK